MTMTRAALSLLLGLALAACKREAPPLPAKTASPEPKPAAPAPKAAPTPVAKLTPASQPASAPTSQAASAPSSAPAAFGASALTPKLEAVVQGLRALSGEVKVKDALAKLIPGSAGDDGKDLPEEGKLELLEVRQARTLMAFFRVTPKGHKACDEKGPQREVYALHIASEGGAERLRFSTSAFSASESRLFEARKPARVVFPAAVPTLPLFEVHYDHETACADDEAQSGEKVEVYHLGSRERVGDPIPVATSREVPGNEKQTRAKLEWLAGKAAGSALLVVTRLETDTTHPCTGEPDNRSPECRPQVECDRTTRVALVTAEGGKEPAPLAELRRREPALARLPGDRSGKSEKACARLAPR